MSTPAPPSNRSPPDPPMSVSSPAKPRKVSSSAPVTPIEDSVSFPLPPSISTPRAFKLKTKSLYADA
ncbi:hypothetical protein CW354_22755 [Marinicaulis flavus]|uniref:Uncharacterized protein n=1 Tax=Hyphococcus luteus TaxID=2058213 RepID=A0A2S7K024_9PROT|nr:hypothetical protein CW354_22755 [Marinicaulis flavus]